MGWKLQFFFGDAVCCVHLWSKSSSPKISRALLFLFSCSFINKRTASNYQFSFFFPEKRYVAFICFHERSLTKWNNAKIPKISTRIFSMPRPANRERLSTPRTTSEFIAFCQRMKQPDYIYDTRSIAWRNVIDIEWDAFECFLKQSNYFLGKRQHTNTSYEELCAKGTLPSV